VREIERYVVWPGQACSYKIGQTVIANLRAEAERRLGNRFDIRAFHDAILLSGAMPLTVLERRIPLQPVEQAGGALGIGADPAVVDALYRYRVEMIPAFPSLAADDDQPGFLEHPEMLHHRAAVEAGKARHEVAGRPRPVLQFVQQGAPGGRGQRLENPVLARFV
jgi:hypothetical protein